MASPVPRPVLRRQRSPRGSGDRLRDEILDAATELLLDTGGSKAVSHKVVRRLTVVFKLFRQGVVDVLLSFLCESRAQ